MLDPRRSAPFLVLVALMAIALLALSLPEVRLGPGLPLPKVLRGQFLLGGARGGVSYPIEVSRAALIALFAGMGATLLVALWRTLRGARLWTVLWFALRGLLAFAGIAGAILLLSVLAPPAAPIPVASTPLLPTPPRVAVSAPLAPPSTFVWLVAAGFVLASALAAAVLLRAGPGKRDPVLVRLGLEADHARAALEAGMDARAVILACYARMTAALAEARGIERPGPMTAREFGEKLGGLGLPLAPVRELTALFEVIRYGQRSATQVEEARAVACLGPIIEHCRAGQSEGTS